uniref:Uncharacterized protein n=1 Tax=Rhizophora mucronata TaxID=61149 RepID=A0A2P2IH50_RHIMU
MFLSMASLTLWSISANPKPHPF